MDFANHPGLLYVVATLLPLASFVILLLAGALRQALRSSPEGSVGEKLFQNMGGETPARWPAWVATGAMGLAFVCSLVGFILYSGDSSRMAELKEERHARMLKHAKLKDEGAEEEDLKAALSAFQETDGKLGKLEQRWKGQATWIILGAFNDVNYDQASALEVGFKIDSLTAIMFLMVTLVATLIHLFSMGYMGEELDKTVTDHHVHTEEGHLRRRGRYGRFFLFLSLFCFSMLNLILADNLFQVFVSWELVGICSYLLIGFYYERQSAANASNKAFITNRIGDAGFIIGLLIVWTYVGTFNFDEIFKRIRSPLLDSHGQAGKLGGQFVRANPDKEDPNYLTVPKEGDGSEVVLFYHVPSYGPAHYHPPERGSSIHTGERYQLTDKRIQALEREGVPKEVLGKLKVSESLQEGYDSQELFLSELKQTLEEDEFARYHAMILSRARIKTNGSIPYWMLVVAGLGIFLGCVGKSAQFPLHVWLPDAMEGPTPVSALIHAATMVAAGVYLVGRVYPLFTPEARLVIAYTGAITLFVAATIAIVMTDIKKVLAYSTVSQLGYMMLALGIGGWVAGLFHLLTHAFFKALLFLGSGSVIYGCHHEQEMTKMGGLHARMKITSLTMLMGVLAIAGIPAFSGWYSKDAIVASALGFVRLHPEHILLFLLPLVTAALTTFYMFRMWFMTFTGKPRDHHVHEHAKESPRTMTIPLIVLAFFSVTVAWGWPFFSSHFPFVNAETSWLESQIHHSQPESVQADFGSTGVRGHETWYGPAKSPRESERNWALEYHHLAGNLALGMVVLGLVFAVLLYYNRVLDPAEGKEQFPGVHRFLSAKWYFDELYSAMIVRPSLRIAHWCRTIDLKGIDWLLDNTARFTVKVSQWDGRFDNKIVDGIVNLIATVAYGVGSGFRRVQTGYLRSYVLFLVLAAVGIFVILSYVVT